MVIQQSDEARQWQAGSGALCSAAAPLSSMACCSCTAPVLQSVGASPLPEVHLCLFADNVAEPPANTLDGGHGIHDVLLAVHIGVENTQDVLEVVSCHQALQSRAITMKSTALLFELPSKTPQWQLLLQANYHQLMQRQSLLTPMVGPSLPADSQETDEADLADQPCSDCLDVSLLCTGKATASSDLKLTFLLLLLLFSFYFTHGHRDSAVVDL